MFLLFTYEYLLVKYKILVENYLKHILELAQLEYI